MAGQHRFSGTTVSLLDGKLKARHPTDFSRDSDDPKEPKTIVNSQARMARGTVCAAHTDLPGPAGRLSQDACLRIQ